MAGKHLQIANQMLKAFATKNKFGVSLGAEKLRAVSADEGNVKVEFEVADHMANNMGVLHGGYTATLVDVCTTLALLCSKSGRPGVSTDLHVSYISGAKVGETVVVDATITKQGKSIGFTKADLYRKKDNVLIASGIHTKCFPQKQDLSESHKEAFK